MTDLLTRLESAEVGSRRRAVRHVSTFSLGGGSWNTARIVQNELVQPGDEHLLVFTDTLYEDADAYRFGLQAACQIFGRDYSWVPLADAFPDYRAPEGNGIEEYSGNPEWRRFLAELRVLAAVNIPELIWLVEGRDIWEVWRDERFLGNSRVDPCSRILKRKPLEDWLKANCDPAETVIYFGIGTAERHRYEDWNEEEQRFTGIKPRYAAKGWNAQAPMIDRIEGDLRATLYMQRFGLIPSRQYSYGYAHDNCGGDCCKAGQRHHTRRFWAQPERAAYDAMRERQIIAFLGKDVARLVETVDGEERPLTLDELHRRIRSKPDLFVALLETPTPDGEDGCACMIEEAA